mmetsp:Transcript_91467/g.158571  ORF Transcript_91467/g.158571 Transcript_91467/m.158571 type:complete len:258 (+) Transcript_91467:4622-5395(+)
MAPSASPEPLGSCGGMLKSISVSRSSDQRLCGRRKAPSGLGTSGHGLPVLFTSVHHRRLFLPLTGLTMGSGFGDGGSSSNRRATSGTEGGANSGGTLKSISSSRASDQRLELLTSAQKRRVLPMMFLPIFGGLVTVPSWVSKCSSRCRLSFLSSLGITSVPMGLTPCRVGTFCKGVTCGGTLKSISSSKSSDHRLSFFTSAHQRRLLHVRRVAFGGDTVLWGWVELPGSDSPSRLFPSRPRRSPFKPFIAGMGVPSG